MLGKRGNAIIVVGLIIVIIIMAIVWIVTTVDRGCREDADCGEGFYCDVHHDCNAIPVIEKTNTIVEKHYDFVWPALFLGLAVIIAAIIFRTKDSPRVERQIRERRPISYQTKLILGVIALLVLILLMI